MALNDILNQVKRAIFDDPTTPHQEGNDPSGLISKIEGILGGAGAAGLLGGLLGGSGAAGQAQGGGYGNIRPASEDPYGDPADLEPAGGIMGELQSQFPGLKSASEDPLGDPADEEGSLSQQFPGLKPASQDPHGDPADQGM